MTPLTRWRRRLPPWSAPGFLLVVGLVVGVAASGCSGRTSAPPEAGYERGGVPNLRGERVLLLPPQLVSGGHRDLEQELIYALTSRGSEVAWVTPEDLRRRFAASPAMTSSPDALPVDRFLLGEIQRVGDPLFGTLYRMAAVESASWAIVPVQVRERDGVAEGTRVVEMAVALVHPRSGRVAWYGIVDGSEGPAGALPATASAVEALARRILR